MTTRQAALTQWLKKQLGHDDWILQPQSGDASFRYYFRLQVEGRELIAVDAVPEKENNNIGFIAVTHDLAQQGLCVPEIVAADPTLGFMLLSFLGETLYQQALTPHSVESLYQDALSALVILQNARSTTDYVLPLYDETLLRRELSYFVDWFCGHYLAMTFSVAEQAMVQHTFDLLVENALSQPQVYVHRDYHSRNLIVVSGNNPGIIDYQDAVWGAITYDLVSLLRDCYVAWTPAQVNRWALTFFEQVKLTRPALREVSPETFLYWFDLMGIQRHLKVMGIFARKYKRDGTPFYLRDIPRIMMYIQTISGQHALLKPLHQFFVERIMPLWREHAHPTPISNEIYVQVPI